MNRFEQMAEQLLCDAEKMEARAADLRSRAGQYATMAQQFPDEDPYEDGTVLSFKKQFTPDGTVYDYTALRCNGAWYTSGPKSAGQAYSWQDLIRFWQTGVEHVFIAKRWELEYSL